ncbi:acyl-CoA dehydrogenase family protein [Mycobacterium branderi]|uniref:Acyl-CoA dehydrogenase n=1 Tax=Mycobacterium branderi TaxID=43348 RepID=A0A7I7WFH2_9MYCO|nr:acyl-CoA dehydrogenase family protein [Mycobacterium branderi]MCV7231746.1 acyl-CoA/acyl-ACP dehydrogenase [Mycobacterium branderi]ORA40287.1 hypothetical protein BST20_06975 [Mycobacterium branderi]BBZ15602.1 acyl-CoA dehydrogenase [Mycobacterium branderi]
MTATIDQDHALLATTARSYFGGFVDNNYLNEQEDSAQGFETARWKQMCELGWTAIGLPGRVGGGDGDLALTAIIAKEAGRAAFASPLLQTLRAAAVLDTLNGDRRFDGVLRRIAEGATTSLIAPPDKTIRAAADGDSYLLGGEPAVVQWLIESEVAIAVLPRSDRSGWLCAELDRNQITDRAESVRSTDNERATRFDADGLVVCREQVLADDLPDRHAAYALARADLLRASVMVGGSEDVLARTADYARQRNQFGQPIGAFQAVRHHLARMVIAVDAAQLVCDEALTRATPDAHESAIAAVASFVAGRSYVDVVLTAAQLHGGVGTTTEHILHHHYRRAKAMQLRSGLRANRLRDITAALVCRGEGSLW